jgi:hypothetical protein
MGMSTYRRENRMENIIESVVRLPWLCAEIKQQANIVSGYDQMKKELEDPQNFAFALICGLVTKQGFNIVLKRSIDSVTSDMLYDITQEKSFAEYEIFKAFKAILNKDGTRRSDIDTMRRELLMRISDSAAEKEAVAERVAGIAKTYSNALPDIKRRLDNTSVDKRKPLKDTYAFYAAVLKVAEKYRDDYLV